LAGFPSEPNWDEYLRFAAVPQDGRGSRWWRHSAPLPPKFTGNGREYPGACGNNLCRMLLTHQVISWSESMRYVLAALLAVSALGVLPARSEDTEPGTSLALLERNVTTGLSRAVHPDRERNTALIKEDEFETPETIAIIEKTAKTANVPL
jgi:hypothetical protein